MDDTQNDKLFATLRQSDEPVRDDVRQSRNNLLVRSGYPALSAGRHFSEQTPGSVYSLCYSRRGAGIANRDVGY
jgi:hypothetical protein